MITRANTDVLIAALEMAIGPLPEITQAYEEQIQEMDEIYVRLKKPNCGVFVLDLAKEFLQQRKCKLYTNFRRQGYFNAL